MRDVDEIRSLMSPADPAAGVDVTRGATAQELIARAETTPASAPVRRTGRRRAWTLAGAAAVSLAVAAAIVIPITGDHGVEPAYAVTKQQNGDVRVDIEALNDAADFQRQMLRAGVPTEVETVPAGMHCADHGLGYMGLKFELRRTGRHTAKLVSFLVDPDWIKQGQTLVLETHGTRVTSLYIAEAPHRCVPVR